MSKLIGSILLMLGTCVGVAVLALPIVTAGEPFYVTVFLVGESWLLMSLGAWALFAVTKDQPLSANLLSLSSTYLGKTVRLITWVVYLLLLYALICAYLAGSSDIVQSALSRWHCPRWLATVIATLILGGIVYRGMAWVDWSNRFLMLTKLALLVALLAVIAPHTFHSSILAVKPYWPSFSHLMVIITSLGFAIIIPSLRRYLNDDRKQLAWALAVGSFLPLVIYLVWIGAVQSVVPWYGDHGLRAMDGTAHTTTAMMTALARVTEVSWLRPVAVAFVSLSALTAFLSVSVCLVDFLADGIPSFAGENRRWALIGLTYIPPMLIVLCDPSLFVAALSWAGYFCLYILILLPIGMWVTSRWRG